MSLYTILICTGGTGKSCNLKDLFQSKVFKSEQPEEHPVMVVTLEMTETVDLSKQSDKMDFHSMLVEAFRELCFQEKINQWKRYLKQKLSNNQYCKMAIEHTDKMNSTIEARIKEYVASQVQDTVDIQKCIDVIRDDLMFAIEAIRSNLQEYVEHVFCKSQCLYIRNVVKELVGHIEHLGRNQNVRENPIRVLFKRRLTEPNQVSQYISLCLRLILQDRMLGSTA